MRISAPRLVTGIPRRPWSTGVQESPGEHFEVGGDDFYIDLLFFDVEQVRYFVIELKTGTFQPQYCGKLCRPGR
ncbi:PDDEXK nuclease domain-containing protein [Arthrobacter antioxidans]|uniref:PDDEXK nuclease domain-containing protein n=1 Tax=Arthrobacter antioxidans TaxID=2895818 RepID=UPI003AF0BE13